MFHKALTRLTTIMALTTMAALGSATAAEYPNKPVQIVVPFPAGSITDTVGRIIAERLTVKLGQPVIIQNKPGAGATIGSADVARAAPDGYTVLFGGNSTLTINPYLYKKLPYDPAKAFDPLTIAGEIPTVLIARPGLGIKPMQDLVSAAKKAPGSISVATGSTTAQVAVAALNRAAGINLISVPYKGEPLGLTDLLGGHVDLMILNLPVAYQYLQEEKVIALALPGNRNVQALPHVPLVSETVPGYVMPNGWLAFWVPAGTPAPIAQRLQKELVAVLNEPQVHSRIEATGGYVLYTGTPAQLRERTEQDAAKWSQLIKESGIEPQ